MLCSCGHRYMVKSSKALNYFLTFSLNFFYENCMNQMRQQFPISPMFFHDEGELSP